MNPLNKCPSCKQNLDPKTLTLIGVQETKTRELVLANCEHCKSTIVIDSRTIEKEPINKPSLTDDERVSE